MSPPTSKIVHGAAAVPLPGHSPARPRHQRPRPPLQQQPPLQLQQQQLQQQLQRGPPPPLRRRGAAAHQGGAPELRGAGRPAAARGLARRRRGGRGERDLGGVRGHEHGLQHGPGPPPRPLGAAHLRLGRPTAQAAQPCTYSE